MYSVFYDGISCTFTDHQFKFDLVFGTGSSHDEETSQGVIVIDGLFSL